MDRAVARDAVGGAQLRPDHHVADEGVARQIAVGVVVTVAEAAFLFAVPRIVGGVEVEHHLASVAPQALHAEAQQERLGPDGVEVHLVVAALAVTGLLQPVERGSGGERRAVEHFRRGRQERIVTQGCVVVEVLVAGRQPSTRWASSVRTDCVMRSGSRRSTKPPASLLASPSERARSRNSSTPASELRRPPSKLATSCREPAA